MAGKTQIAEGEANSKGRVSELTDNSERQTVRR